MVSDRRMMPSALIKKVSVKLILLSFIFLPTLFSNHCCAQTTQNQTISITTYYPARYGVYKNPRLIPLDEEPTSLEDKQEGTIYFNNTNQKLYIFNGTQWVEIGSGGSGFSGGYAGTGLKIYSDHLVSPDECYSDPAKVLPYSDTELCSWNGWFKTITFPGNFIQPPHVIVVVERNPDIEHSPCTDGITDSVLAIAEQITNTSFRIRASGSPSYWSTCGALEGKRARAKVGWIAIGK